MSSRYSFTTINNFKLSNAPNVRRNGFVINYGEHENVNFDVLLLNLGKDYGCSNIMLAHRYPVQYYYGSKD